MDKQYLEENYIYFPLTFCEAVKIYMLKNNKRLGLWSKSKPYGYWEIVNNSFIFNTIYGADSIGLTIQDVVSDYFLFNIDFYSIQDDKAIFPIYHDHFPFIKKENRANIVGLLQKEPL